MTLAPLIASGGGVGRFPVAPGTVASLVALVIGAAVLAWAPVLLPPLVLAATGLGVWSIRALGTSEDSSWIVIDEYAGQWLAMLGIGTLSWQSAAGAFVLFRLLDIAKPGPVGWADRRHGPVWIMADDLVAGAIAAALLLAARHVFPALPP
jgi:phosphatidylglycerophosphatase A